MNTKPTKTIFGDNNENLYWNNNWSYNLIPCAYSKTEVLQNLNPHYSNNIFSGGKSHSIYGKEDDTLFYVYNDRLDHSFWTYCWLRVTDEGFVEPTAEKYEKALQYYFNSPDLRIGNIKVGVNVSNGYSYQIYGFRAEKTDSTSQISLYDKMVESDEYKAIKEVHREYVKQEKAYNSAVSAQKYNHDRIKQLEREIEALKKAIPEQEEKINQERAKLPEKKKMFDDIKGSTCLPMPYHAEIWIY
jgi:hypothetical protein